MSGLAYFTRKPLRAIEVRPVDATGERWQASYAGDQWTPALRFDPPMAYDALQKELWWVKDRRGLPIVIVSAEPGEVAA